MAYPTDSSPDHMPDYLKAPIMDHKVHPKVTMPKKGKGGLASADEVA